MNRQQLASELLKAAHDLYAAEFEPGDYIYQHHKDEPVYARVIERQKNGGYKVVMVGGLGGTRPSIKSTKGWYPAPKRIKESEVPDKFKKAIAKKYKGASVSKAVARELLGAARILMGQEKRITKNTVKSVLNKLDLLDKVELSSTDVTFWPENFSEDWHEGYDMAQHAAHTFSHVLDDLPVRSTGNHFTVRYKGEFIDMGEFNMPSSRWHY